MFCYLDQFEKIVNHDIKNIITPINVDKLEELLLKSKYDSEESQFFVNRFKYGFDIGYEGNQIRRDTAKNIPFREVGSDQELWEKLMSEVELGRYAGLFNEDELPFENFMQSPIGLVPKAGNKNKTRLIFHLPYNFNKQEGTSFNANTPKEKCSAKYNDLDEAIKNLPRQNQTRCSSNCRKETLL